MEEVVGSIPTSSTEPDAVGRDREGFELAGLVAGEGCFSTKRQGVRVDGSPRLRFVFAIEMAERDRRLLERLQLFLGAGTLTDAPSRRPGHAPSVTFEISSSLGHHSATIPFADRYLVFGAKREQFLHWKAALAAYEAAHPPRWGRGRGVCSVPGCGRPVRGQGLCRSHYYERTGH